jgi:hypothetical protein
VLGVKLFEASDPDGVLVAIAAASAATAVASSATAAAVATSSSATAIAAATSSSSAAITATSTSAAATTTGSGSSRSSFIDGHGTAADVFAIEILDGLFGTFGIRHFNKSESSTASGFSIHDDVDSRHFAELLKRAPKILIGG